MVHKVNIKIDNKKVSTSDAKKYVSQLPNSKIFGFWKFNLGIYNLSSKDSAKKLNKFFQDLGEPPVLFEASAVERSVRQLKYWMANKGYYHALVSDTVLLKKKKAIITYNIVANEPHTIDNVFQKKKEIPSNFLSKRQMEQQFSDTSDIRKKHIVNYSKTLLKKNELLDTDLLHEERNEMSTKIRNDGYYDFAEEYINFLIDTFKIPYKADVYWDVKKDEITTDSIFPDKKYKIRKTFYHLIPIDDDQKKIPYDTLVYKNICFIYRGKPMIKPDILKRTNFITDSTYYNLDNIDATYERLRRLNQFRLINISFEKVGYEDNFGYIDCHIRLVPYKKQAYTIELETTTNSGNFGVLGNLTYQHKNLLRSAEILNVELLGGYERVENSQLKKFDATQFGVSANLTTPKFLFPLGSQNKLTKKYNPYTEFLFTFNYHDRPRYTRIINATSFSYKWKGKGILRHIFTPLDLGVIKIKKLDEDFFQSIRNIYLRSSFQDHIISASRYSIIYNDSFKEKKTNGKYMRFTIELAGNLLSLYDRITGTNKESIHIGGTEIDRVYKHFDIQYAQYVRSDLDFSFYHHIDNKNQFVYHFFFGLGYPYGNSQVMPFEKLYFAGGVNSMRAWQARTLGPGSSQVFTKDDNLSYADMRLEANFEYRFSLIKNLEGAFFVDIGNVWAITNLYNDENARFKINRFYQELGVGTGLGLRLNFDFLLLRLDTGIRVFDPFLPKGQRFVPNSEGWKFSDLVFNFGIGYPF